jgi:hypothetical protein
MNSKLKSEKILINVKKIILINSMGGCCQLCKEKNHFKLVFHHNNEDIEKSFHFGEYRKNRFSILKAEMEKCILLCQNCHRELHYNDVSQRLKDDTRRKNKKIYLEYSGTECIKCGYDKSPAALCFHHRNPSEKSFPICDFNRKIDCIKDLDDIIKVEMDKCDILCANCHVLEHSDINFFEKYKNEIQNKIITYKEKQKKIDRHIVIEMYNNGSKQIDIAKHFSASKGTISDIIKKYKNGG